MKLTKTLILAAVLSTASNLHAWTLAPPNSTDIITTAVSPYPIITLTGLKCPNDGATGHGTNHDPMIWYGATRGVNYGGWLNWESPHRMYPGEYVTAFFHHACTNHASPWAAFLITEVSSNSAGISTNYFTGIVPAGVRVISASVSQSSSPTSDAGETNLCLILSNTNPTNNPVSTGTNSLSPMIPGCSCSTTTNVDLQGQTNYVTVCVGTPSPTNQPPPIWVPVVDVNPQNPPWQDYTNRMQQLRGSTDTHPDIQFGTPPPVNITPSPVPVPNWAGAVVTVRGSEPGYVTSQVTANPGESWQELDGTNAYAMQFWPDMSHTNYLIPTNQLYIGEDVAAVYFLHVVTSNYWSNSVSPLGTNRLTQFYWRVKSWGTNFPSNPTF
ncbi:MAG TPA: hypothetical protein VN281_11490 [Verrucomicrobiae bacterium]|nr:hypothetical protein [Verrucomicrobiae bacterium]